MTDLFLKILNMSITAGWLILAILLLRVLFCKMPKYISVLMWALVGLRLICPFSFESGLSLIPSAKTIPQDIVYSSEPAIQSGIPVVNNMINGIMAESFAPNPAESVNPLQVVVGISSVIWIVGMCIMVLYAVTSAWKVKKSTREAVWWKENIWICDQVKSPFIFGLIRPRIYIPSNLEEQDVSHVIIHEKAHLKRKDHWWKPFGFLLLTLYWFHPLCWSGYVMLCRDIELACDEKVLRDMNLDEKKSYANALINCSISKKMITACPLAFGEVGVKTRVKSILNYKKPAFWVVLAGIVICGFLVISFMTNPVKEQEESNLEKMYPQYYGLPMDEELTVYIWQMSSNSFDCVLVAGESVEWPYGELLKLKATSIREMREILAANNLTREDVTVKFIDMPISSFAVETDEEYKKYVEDMFWRNPNVSHISEDDWGLSMTLTFKDATKFEVMFSHNSEWMKEEGELSTSAMYGLYAIHNGEMMQYGDYMRKVLGKDDYEDQEYAWDDAAHIIEKDGVTTIEGDLFYTYRELPPGTYQLWKRVMLKNEKGEEQYRIYTVDFAIAEEVFNVN